MLGYEQSYISALETGGKGTPLPAFIDTVILKMSLDEADIVGLREAWANSMHTIRIPKQASPEIYRLCHDLEKQLPILSSNQVQLIQIALRIH